MGLKYILKYLTTTAHKLNEVLVMVRKRVKILTLDFIMYTEVSVMTTERIYLESSKRKTRENKMTLWILMTSNLLNSEQELELSLGTSDLPRTQGEPFRDSPSSTSPWSKLQPHSHVVILITEPWLWENLTFHCKVHHLCNHSIFLAF